VVALVAACPFRCPAPIVYRPGEGWVWESVGGEKWVRTRAKDQLEVAEDAYKDKDYSLTTRASRRVVKIWPLSDYAPRAQYLLARAHEETGDYELAFGEYNTLLQNYTKDANYEDVLKRQYDIAGRYLNGQRFKLWGFIPTLPSMEKTVSMYEKVIKNGPYSEVAAQSQLNIGQAYEQQSKFLADNQPYVQAARAYALAVDRYRDRPRFAAEAQFREGLAFEKQARTAEYDQGTAGQAIDAFSDFKTWYPNDPRIDEADKIITSLRQEQARGSFETAKFYESNRQWKAAQIYYNEVLVKSPDSPFREKALERIAALSKYTEPQAK
jgi:outer membrane protein assembly factor BamD